MSKKATPKARVFIPLTKVDEVNQLVYGRITQELLDKAGEVMDYDTSKPFFEKWSAGISEASNGLSKGNVRVMHGLVAAGKLTELNFDDDDKAIDVCAKVVDANEWEKVQEGVYTGFSVGGSYAKRWTEADKEDKTKKIKKYTADPVEVSLVDNPCVPSATFTMTKADGSEIAIEFKIENDDDEWPDFAKAAGEEETAEEEQKEAPAPQGELNFVPTNDAVAERAEKLAKGVADKTWIDFVDQARGELVAEHRELNKATTDADKKDETKDGEKDKKEGETADNKKKAADDKSVAKTTPAGVKQVWTSSDGKTFEKKAEAEAHEATLEDEDDPVAKLAKSLREVTGVVEAAEKVVEADTVFDDLDRFEKAVLELELPRDPETGGPALEKGMYTVSRFANMLSDVAGLVRTIKAEAKLEGGDPEDESVVAKVKTALSGFGGSFLDYAKEQVAEMLAGMDVDLAPRACYDYYYRAAEADPENTLAKDVCSLIDGVKEYMPDEEELAKRAPVDTMSQGGDLQKKFDELQDNYNKLSGQHEKLIKLSSEAIDQLGGLAKRVKAIEETPEPRAPTGNVLGKTADNAIAGTGNMSPEDRMQVIQEMVKTLGPDAMATMMIKAAQANPQNMVGGF